MIMALIEDPPIMDINKLENTENTNNNEFNLAKEKIP